MKLINQRNLNQFNLFLLGPVNPSLFWTPAARRHRSIGILFYIVLILFYYSLDLYFAPGLIIWNTIHRLPVFLFCSVSLYYNLKMKSSDSILLLIGWIPFVTFMSTLTGMMLIGGESLFYYPWGFLFILFAPYFGRVLPYRIAGLNSLVNVLLLFLTDIFFYHYNWKIRIISGFTLSLLILFSFLVTRSNQMNMIQFHTLTKTSPKEKMENFARHYKISPREKEVLLHMLTGDPRNRIAEKLNISLHTVKSHINSIYTKCCVSSKTELFKLYESFL